MRGISAKMQQALFVVMFIFAIAIAVDEDDQCTTDGECERDDVNTHCLKYSGCDAGSCQCKPGYYTTTDNLVGGTINVKGDFVGDINLKCTKGIAKNGACKPDLLSRCANAVCLQCPDGDEYRCRTNVIAWNAGIEWLRGKKCTADGQCARGRYCPKYSGCNVGYCTKVDECNSKCTAGEVCDKCPGGGEYRCRSEGAGNDGGGGGCKRGNACDMSRIRKRTKKCTTDSDCTRDDIRTYCFKYSGCGTGYCICKRGYSANYFTSVSTGKCIKSTRFDLCQKMVHACDNTGTVCRKCPGDTTCLRCPGGSEYLCRSKGSTMSVTSALLALPALIALPGLNQLFF